MKSLCLFLVLLAGCSGICIETESPKRRIVGFSFLTDRLISKMDVATHEGSTFHIEGANSNQSTGAEIAVRALVPALRLLLP